MNRKQWLVGCLCLGLSLVAGTAWGQRGGMMFGGGGSLASILRIEEVQKELGLEGETLEKVNAFLEEAQTAMRDKLSELRDEGLERDEMMAEMQKFNAQVAEKEAKELGGVLSADQMKRANQLLVQRLGFAAVTRPEVAKAIGLSADELKDLKAKIADLDKTRNEKFREAMENQDREAFQEINAEYQKNLSGLFGETLNDEQKKAFEEYQGEKFTFPEPQRGGDGGGRRRNDF